MAQVSKAVGEAVAALVTSAAGEAEILQRAREHEQEARAARAEAERLEREAERDCCCGRCSCWVPAAEAHGEIAWLQAEADRLQDIADGLYLEHQWLTRCEQD